MQLHLIKTTRFNFQLLSLQAGLVAGTLDLTGAILVYVVLLKKASLMQLLQGIASGIFGIQAFQGGWGMALLGLAFHYGIAYIFTTMYLLHLAYRPQDRRPLLRIALIYGIIVWMVMNLLVVPLSNAPGGRLTLPAALIGASILIVFFALPLTWFVKRHLKLE